VRAIFATPRPVPSRLVPVAAGAAVVALALPVFAVAGWRLSSWALGATLWLASQALALLLARLPLGMDNLAASAAAGIGTSFRGAAVMVVLIAVAASDARLALGAAAVYALAYTLELGLSLATYFGSPAR